MYTWREKARGRDVQVCVENSILLRLFIRDRDNAFATVTPSFFAILTNLFFLCLYPGLRYWCFNQVPLLNTPVFVSMSGPETAIICRANIDNLNAPTNNICRRVPLAWAPTNETLSRTRKISLELGSATKHLKRLSPLASIVNCYKRAGGDARYACRV